MLNGRAMAYYPIVFVPISANINVINLSVGSGVHFPHILTGGQNGVRRALSTYPDRCASTLPRRLLCQARRAMRRDARAHTREFLRLSTMPH